MLTYPENITHRHMNVGIGTEAAFLGIHKFGFSVQCNGAQEVIKTIRMELLEISWPKVEEGECEKGIC